MPSLSSKSGVARGADGKIYLVRQALELRVKRLGSGGTQEGETFF